MADLQFYYDQTKFAIINIRINRGDIIVRTKDDELSLISSELIILTLTLHQLSKTRLCQRYLDLMINDSVRQKFIVKIKIINYIRQFMTTILTRRLTSNISLTNNRQFWSWLNYVWNRYDRKRVQEIGPDRACAEWLLRCSGSVRFKNWTSITSDYNAIPSGGPGQCKLEEIRAIKACITSDGFAYLDGLTDLKKIHLEKCDQVGDGSIIRFKKVNDTLESIALIDLVQISDNGLSNLSDLKNLKQIILARLPGIKNREGIIKLLHNELPKCTVNYDDDYPPAPELKDK
ncbi:unnamed protein product [Rotaria sordida]|uniref:ATP synthase subunit s, mitochondrial n=1 Tax=Rotaria sordida TaxID=392033 RepID=A0A815LN94_9BILA|nr:unnamed protein product [Rotaria sordida]